jgi:hypothetical protein
MDGPATTCAEEEDDALLPAGSRLAVRVEFSGTAPTDIEFSMTISPIVG